jgi:hypothetical protein
MFVHSLSQSDPVIVERVAFHPTVDHLARAWHVTVLVGPRAVQSRVRVSNEQHTLILVQFLPVGRIGPRTQVRQVLTTWDTCRNCAVVVESVRDQLRGRAHHFGVDRKHYVVTVGKQVL